MKKTNKSMISYIVYVIYNFIIQVGIIGFLFYANTYLNEFIIPSSLRWKNGRLREDLTAFALVQALILILEALLLIFLLHLFNKWYLASVVNARGPERIAFLTSVVLATITVLTIVIATYINFL